jgi:excisionase family DNA binding protein
MSNTSYEGADKKSLPLAVKVSEAARLLNLHPDTLRRYLQKGRLKGVQLGQWLIPFAEIRRLFNQGSEK